MKRMRKLIIITGAVTLLLPLLGGCAALRGTEGDDARREYDPNRDGYDYYDDFDDYYYEHMGY